LRASPIGFSRFQRLELRLRLYSRGKSSPQYTPPQVSSGKFGVIVFPASSLAGSGAGENRCMHFQRAQGRQDVCTTLPYMCRRVTTPPVPSPQLLLPGRRPAPAEGLHPSAKTCYHGGSAVGFDTPQLGGRAMKVTFTRSESSRTALSRAPSATMRPVTLRDAAPG